MGSATLKLNGKNVLDNDTGLPIKIKFKGDKPNEEQIEKLKILKNDIQQDIDQPVSGAGSVVDNQLGMLFSSPTMAGTRINYQAGKDIISNIASVGFDLAAFYSELDLPSFSSLVMGTPSLMTDKTDAEKKETTEFYEQTAENIRNFLPDVADLPTSDGQTFGQANPFRQNIEDAIATGGQYIAPAVGVTRLTNASQLPKALKYGTNLLGITASDVAVTDPEKAMTVADAFGINISPTKINEDDSALEKRLKVGAETIPAVLGIDSIVKGVKSVLPASIKESVSAPFSEEVQKNLLAKNMSKNIYQADPEKFPSSQFNRETKLPDDVTDQLIANIDEAVEIGNRVGVTPTVGTSSKNVGLIAMERNISTAKGTSSAMTNRKIQNIASMTNALQKSLKTQPLATSEFVETTATKLRASEDLKNQLNINLQEAIDETDNLITGFTKYAKKDPSILSSNIDTALRKDLQSLVSNKNKLFNNIDPNGTVILDRAILRDALKNSTQSKTPKLTSSLLNTLTKNVLNDKKTGAIYNTLKKLASNKTKTPLTYQQLSAIRPILTSKINTYLKSDEANGEVVKRLSAIKKSINDYTEKLINKTDKSVSDRAKEALVYYKDTFTPAWKEGVGKIYKDGIQRNKPFFPSEVGNKFIIGKPVGGSKETIKQLNNMISRASKDEVSQAKILDDVNDYVLYQFANNVTGKNAKTNLNAVKRFIRNYKQILKTPEFSKSNKIIEGAKRELQIQDNKILSNNAKLKELQSNISQRQKDLSYKALNNLIDLEPNKFANAVLKLPIDKALKTIQEAKALTKDNPLAQQGLKNVFIDFAEESLTKFNVNAMGGDSVTTAVARFNSFMTDNTAKIYQEILGKKGLNTVKDVHSLLKNFENINLKAVTDSDVTILAQTLNNSRLFLASMYGIIRGSAIFRLSELLSKALGFQPQATMESLMVRSFLDPELGKEMLRRANQQNVKPFALKMKGYIANNLPQIQSEGTENKPKRFRLAE
tara:strand:+ start:5120 stop:8110 length:2991 start_codon:yes stop_codon:yes gene_type:complete